MKYSKKKFEAAKKDRFEAVGRRCQWCGRPLQYRADIFAHIKGRNVGTPEDAEIGFVVVCPNWHIYQTTKAGNLESDPCVSSYLKQGGGGKGYRFFDLILSKINGN